MLLNDAIERFATQARARQVRNRKTGRSRQLSDTRIGGIVSHVKNAVCRASGAPREQVEGVELAPYMAVLAEAGRKDAEEAGRASPRNEAANVRLFLATIEGCEYEVSSRHGYAERRPVSADRVLPAWRPLYDALERLAEEDRGTRSFRGQLVTLQDLAVTHGIQDPHAIPDDWDAVLGWVLGAGMNRKKFHAVTAAFRKARDLTSDASLPTLYQRLRNDERGLRSLPNLVYLLKARDCEADPIGLSTLEMIHFLAPKFAKALERHLAWGREKSRSPGWIDEQIGMTGRILASLIRLGRDPYDMTYVSLFEEPAEVPGGGDVDEVLADVMGDDYAGEPEQTSLIRAVMDESARNSFEHSPLWLIEERETATGVQLYTDKVRDDLLYCYCLTKAVFGTTMGRLQKKRWDVIEQEYERISSYMLDFNEGARVDGHKPKDQVLITFPQAVCIGLHTLRRRALVARAEVESFRARRRTLETRTGRKLVKNFDEAMREYVLLAILLDDGLRIQNYSGALANLHFVPTVQRDASGRWIGFLQVQTRFRGFDDAAVKLKKTTHKNRRERRRRRPLNPALIDHDLLFQYWTEVRPRDLVRRGLLTSVSEFNPDEDRFAVFIAPRKGGRKARKRSPANERRQRSGQFTADQLSTIAGRTLHWIVRDVLGRGAEPHNVPAWTDPARTTEWRAIFAAHVVRLLIGSYWGGIRGDWAHACWITNDKQRTLEENYNEVSEIYEEKERLRGVENVRHFDEVLDRMRLHEPGDGWGAFWDHFDPETPSAALVHLHGVKRIDAGASKPRRGRRGGMHPPTDLPQRIPA